jgi:ferredoxin
VGTTLGTVMFCKQLPFVLCRTKTVKRADGTSIAIDPKGGPSVVRPDDLTLPGLAGRLRDPGLIRCNQSIGFIVATPLCRRFPVIEQGIGQVNRGTANQAPSITPEILELLYKSGQLGVIQADALLVMDLDLCINCDKCVKACEALHGQSRLFRNRIQLGKYLIPSACRHCDAKCMNSATPDTRSALAAFARGHLRRVGRSHGARRLAVQTASTR